MTAEIFLFKKRRKIWAQTKVAALIVLIASLVSYAVLIVRTFFHK